MREWNEKLPRNQTQNLFKSSKNQIQSFDRNDVNRKTISKVTQPRHLPPSRNKIVQKTTYWRLFRSVMAIQAGWSRLRSWLRWSNCAAPAPQLPKPEIPSHRPPFKPPTASQPEVPSRPQLQPMLSSPSTSQPQPGAQTASQTSSQPQQATQSQQATKTTSQPSYRAPSAQPQPPTRTTLQRPSPSRTSPPQPSARTSSQPPSLSRNSQLQQAPQTASQPPSPLHTSLPQQGAQTASQPPSPSHTASQPRAETWTASPSPPASGTESQLQPGTHAASQPQSPSRTTTVSQTAIRSTSKTATPASTDSQARPEAQITSQNPSPSPTSQLQPATTVSKPPSPSQTDIKPQPATHTISQPPSPSRTVSKPQTPTQTSSPPPPPSHVVSQSQPATKTVSQPPSRTASQALSRSRATSQSQQSRQRESQLSPPSKTSPSKPKSPSSPSMLSPQPKPPSSETAESHPTSHPIPKAAQNISANSLEPVLESQTRIQRMQTQARTAEMKSLPAYAEKMPTEGATDAPTSEATLETSTPPESEEFTDASVGTTRSPKLEAKREATENKKLETDIEANPDEIHRIQGAGEPIDKGDGKFLDMASGSNTSTRTHSDVKKQMKQQALLSGNNVATTDSKGKKFKTKTSGNIKDRSTKSETNLKSSASPGEQAALLQKEIREGVSRFIQKLDVGNPKKPGNQQSVSVITFVGENRGASMTAGPNAVDKDSYMYIHRDYKVNKEDEDEVSRDKDGNSKGRSDRRSGSQPMPTCINNNVQSINNSLMYNSSCSERNPGVHLVLSIKPTQPIIMPQEKMETSEAQKAKLKIAPPQQLKTEPTVRRRCLRGLFMESESDQDNPQKPRRHGCRYRCPEDKKDKEGNK